MVMDKISAFMDGESAPTESHQILNSLKQDPDCRAVWSRFHLVGDVMRGESVLRDDFLERLRQKMDNEPTILAPRVSWRATANFALSAAAAIAGVAVVLTLVITDNPLRPQGDLAVAGKAANIRLAETTTSNARPQPAMSANSTQVNEYLLAHQEFSPRTAMQGVVPYVRSVSSMHDGNRR
jgi:sigma-E factor negative regulatory protein RseA